MKFNLDKLIPGKDLPARTINRFIDAVATLSNIQFAAPLVGDSGPRGIHLPDDRTRPFDAMLSGFSSPYSWAEATIDNSTSTPSVVILLGGRTGSANAHEYNAKTGLDGKFATLTPVGESWCKFAF